MDFLATIPLGNNTTTSRIQKITPAFLSPPEQVLWARGGYTSFSLSALDGGDGGFRLRERAGQGGVVLLRVVRVLSVNVGRRGPTPAESVRRTPLTL